MLRAGDIVQNRINKLYGTVHGSLFGFSIHSWGECGFTKTLGLPEERLLEYWEQVEMPEGYELAEYGGIERISANHELKIYPEYFQPVLEGTKSFEIRHDQSFKAGDTLLLEEYCPITNSYTGRKIKRTISYITNYAQTDDYVVLAIV